MTDRKASLTFLVVALVGLLATGTILWRALPFLMPTGGATITWRQLQGPTGGKINCLLVNSENPSTIYAGTDGGVYISVDGAETWQRTRGEGLPPGQEIRTLAMAGAASGQRLYAGTDAGVYYSADDGQSWVSAKAGLAGRLILSLAVDPTNTAVIYAGTDGRIFRSVDGGREWAAIGSEGMPVEAVWSVAIDPTRSTTVYAGTDSGIFKSTDGGQRWQRADTHMPSPLRVQALAVDPQHSDFLYAATEAGIYRSTDAGATWQIARSTLAASEGGELGNSIVHALVIDPADTNILYAAVGVQGIWQSDDAGETWAPVLGNIDELVLSLAVNPVNPRIIYAGTGRGVYYRSGAGQRWEPRNEGLRNTDVLSLVGVPERPGTLFVTTGPDVYRTLDDGQTWSCVSEGFEHLNVLTLAANPGSPDTLYVGTWYSEIYRSQDGGRSWHLVNGGLADNAPVTDLVVQCDDYALHASSQPTKRTVQQGVVQSAGQACEVLFAATNGAGVFFSADDGAHWSAINDGLADLHVQVLALAPVVTQQVPANSAPSLYAGTSDGVYRLRLTAGPTATELAPDSVDDSASHEGWVWEPTRQGLPADEVHSLVVDEWSPNVIYAATATSLGQIYRSVDGGEHWTAIGGGSLPTNIRIQALALYAPRRNAGILLRKGARSADRERLYAATDGGIFRSEDGGQNWRAINDGLPSGADVLAMWVDVNRSYLYSSVRNKGVYFSVDQPPAGIPLALAVGAMLGVIVLAVVLVLWARWLLQSSGRTQEQVFDRNWPAWREEIRRILQEKNVVTTEAMTFIPQTLRLRALQQYVQERGDDNLALRLNPPSLAPVNASQVGSFLRSWRAARKRLNSTAAFRPVVSRIADQLCQLLGFTLLETRSYKRLHGYMVKAPALRLKVPPMFPIVFLQTSEPTEEDFRDLRDLMGILNASSYLALLVIPGAAPGKFLPSVPTFWAAATGAAASPATSTRGGTPGGASVGRGKAGLASDSPGRVITPFGPRVPARRDETAFGDTRVVRGMAAEHLGPVQAKANLRRLASGTAYDFVVLDLDDLYRIFVAKDPERTFVRILLGQVDLTVVSPYVTSGPVPENMFFGRDYELKTISRGIKDNSFAIVGGRKIGKTSILTKLHRSFTDAADFSALYLDCQAVQNYDDLCSALETMWGVTLSNHSPEGIRRLIQQQSAAATSSDKRQDLVILLDEVDALLKYDAGNGERLFKVFRALAQEGYCRFVFCGGKVLHARLHHPDSALFNFCNVIHLSYLTARDTGRIVVEPLQEMGIGFEDASRLVQGIVELSSCHPNIVQYICQELILRINARGDRFITQADLDAIANSSRLSEYMIEVMWGNANALERLLTLLIILERPSATLAQIEAALHERGVHVPTAAVEEALDTLELYSVLNKEDGVYSFTTVAFPSVVAATQDVDLLVERAVQYLGEEA